MKVFEMSAIDQFKNDVVALDEVGTLISKSLTDFYNHYRILRYAARNLLSACLFLAVIVTGTNLSLNSFVLDPIQEHFYRIQASKPYLLLNLKAAATSPPFLDVFHRTNPKHTFGKNSYLLDGNIAPLLTLNQCLSARII
ncbi:hypothetical protein P9112_006461 [Eukaryota sp. TZLM1-RC]